MQKTAWDDLRFVLALYRAGRLAAASRILGVAETTISRRIARLETELETKLFIQTGRGTYIVTDAAKTVLNHAEQMESHYQALSEQVDRASVSGSVRISSVPGIVSQILVPSLSKLIDEHPHLTIELVPEARNVDLTRREADLAVRFARPSTGGLNTKAQKLGSLEFGVFGPAHLDQYSEPELPWIGYDDDGQSRPQAKWTETLRSQSGGDLAPLRVSFLEVAQEAVANGLGKALLPVRIGQNDRRLTKLEQYSITGQFARDVWLLHHNDTYERSAIIVAREWVKQLSWN